MSSLLTQAHFRGFFWTQFFGAFNDNLFKQSLIFMATFQLASQIPKEEADLFVSLGAAIFILPFVLFSNFGAWWCDRWGKTKVIQATKKLEVVIMLLGAGAYFFLDPNNPMVILWLLMAILFLMGTQSALFGPSKYGIMPEILDDQELTEGNSLLEMGTFVGILLGAYGGGWLVESLGGTPSLMALFFVAFAVLGFYSSKSIAPTKANDAASPFPWFFPKQIFQDCKHMKANKGLTATILGVSYFWFAGAIFLQILPGYGIFIGANSIQTNFLMILFSLGIGVGSMLCIPLSRFDLDLGLTPLGGFGLALFALDFGLSPPEEVTGWLSLWRCYADLFLIGLFGGLFIVPINAKLQVITDQSDRAKMMALNNILNALFMVIATAFTLVLRSYFDFTEPQLITATGLVTVVAMGYLLVIMPELYTQAYLWFWSLNKTIPTLPQGGGIFIFPVNSTKDITLSQAPFSEPVAMVVQSKQSLASSNSFSKWRGVIEAGEIQKIATILQAGEVIHWADPTELPTNLKELARDRVYNLKARGANKWEFQNITSQV